MEGLETQVGEAGDAALPGEVAFENAGVLQVVHADGDDVAERVVDDEVARVANHAEAVVGVGDGDDQILLACDFEETERFLLGRAERRLAHHVEAVLWVRRG